MAGRPLRRARRNAQLTAAQLLEEDERVKQTQGRRYHKAVDAYVDALRIDLNPMSHSDDIRRARAIMEKLEREYGFDARQFIAQSRVNSGVRRTIRRNRGASEFEAFIAETGLIPV